MLILTHADGLGVDFHQLCQRVLEAAGNGHGRAQIHIVFREFLRRQGRGGVHRRPGFIDDGIAGLGEGAQQLHRHGLRLPGGGAVADGQVLYLVLAHEGGQGGDGLLLFSFAEGGIDHAGVQHLAGGIHHGHLAAVAVAGVKAHGDEALHRRLHQQRLQIQGEIVDGTLAGPVGELTAYLPLDGGEDQPVIGILRRGTDEGRYIQLGLQRRPADQGSPFISGQGDGGL